MVSARAATKGCQLYNFHIAPQSDMGLLFRPQDLQILGNFFRSMERALWYHQPGRLRNLITVHPLYPLLNGLLQPAAGVNWALDEGRTHGRMCDLFGAGSLNSLIGSMPDMGMSLSVFSVRKYFNDSRLIESMICCFSNCLILSLVIL